MRKKGIIITVLSFVIALTGCGSGNSKDAYYESESSSYVATAAFDTSGNSGSSYFNGQKVDGDSSGTAAQKVENSNRKLIRSFNLSVETVDFDNLIANIDAKISELGGYAESKNVSGDSYNYSSDKNAYYTVRIPSSRVDEFLQDVGKNANITNKTENVSDVTLNYVDIEAHLSSVRVEYDRLLELLSEADSLETIIALESRLAEVRYEIEAYESSLRSIDNKVDYSTVTMYIYEVTIYTPVVEEKTVWQRISVGFSNNLKRAGENIGDFFVGFVTGIPMFFSGLLYVVFVVALILLALWIIRAIWRKFVKKENKSSGGVVEKLVGKNDKSEDEKETDK